MSLPTPTPHVIPKKFIYVFEANLEIKEHKTKSKELQVEDKKVD